MKAFLETQQPIQKPPEDSGFYQKAVFATKRIVAKGREDISKFNSLSTEDKISEVAAVAIVLSIAGLLVGPAMYYKQSGGNDRTRCYLKDLAGWECKEANGFPYADFAIDAYLLALLTLFNKISSERDKAKSQEGLR